MKYTTWEENKESSTQHGKKIKNQVHNMGRK